MNISTSTVTTKVHTGTFSADEIRAVALSYATKQAGLDSASVASSKVDIAADGSVTVQLVEAPVTIAAPAEAPANVETPAAEPASQPATSPAAPHFGFAKTA